MAANKYSLKKIEALRAEAEEQDLDFIAKWDYIGKYFGVSKDAVRKWYYREVAKEAEKKSGITSDQWRTVYLVLTGKSSRDTITNIKRKIIKLCEK